MTRGANLTARQVSDAIRYNRTTLAGIDQTIIQHLGLPLPGIIDEEFVRFVADWQEDNMAVGAGDGKVGPRTEGYLNIQHPLATKAVEKAKAIQSAGQILFDSWGNDVRDNDNDGQVDVGNNEEHQSDGAHFTASFPRFGVVAGMYFGLGWNQDKSITVAASKTVDGPFRYRVCADIVSGAYSQAGVMAPVRATRLILQKFREKGYVWRGDDFYPTKFLPGDFVCTLGESGEGHSGIVVTESPSFTVGRSGTRRAVPPQVVELPGPSTMVDFGTYDPASTNDVRLGTWTKASAGVANQYHFLGRLLLSKLPG